MPLFLAKICNLFACGAESTGNSLSGFLLHDFLYRFSTSFLLSMNTCHTIMPSLSIIYASEGSSLSPVLTGVHCQARSEVSHEDPVEQIGG